MLLFREPDSMRATPIFALFLAGCGSSEVATGKIADHPASNGDAAVSSGGARAGAGGGTSGGGNGGSPGAGGASGSTTGGTFGSGGSTAGGASGASGAASDAGTVADASPPPTEIPSTQTVTFTVTNNSGAERYVATAGNNCMTTEFDRLMDGGQSLVPLAVGFQCPCECPVPGAARPTAFRRVGPGETFEVTWDARGLTTWRQSIDCHDIAPFPPRRSSIVTGVLRPVEPGRFRIVLGVEPTLPAGCSGSGPDYRCDVSYDTNDMSEIAPLCATSAIATADFTLPTSGDIAVSVEIK